MRGLTIILVWSFLLTQVKSEQSDWRPISVPRQMQRRHEFLERLRKENYISSKNAVRQETPNGFNQATTTSYKYGDNRALPGGGLYRYGGNGGSYNMKSGYSYSSGGNLREQGQSYTSGLNVPSRNQVQLGYNGGAQGASINSPSLPIMQQAISQQNNRNMQQNVLKDSIGYGGQGNSADQRGRNYNFAPQITNIASANNYNQNLPNDGYVKTQHPVPPIKIQAEHPVNREQGSNYDERNHPNNNNNAQNNNAGNNLHNGGGVYEANNNFRGPVTPSGNNLNTGNFQNHNNNNNIHRAFDDAAKAGEFGIGNGEPNSDAPNLRVPHRGGNGGPGSQLNRVTNAHYHAHLTHNPTITPSYQTDTANTDFNNVNNNINKMNNNIYSNNNNLNGRNANLNINNNNNNNNENTNLNNNYDKKTNDYIRSNINSNDYKANLNDNNNNRPIISNKFNQNGHLNNNMNININPNNDNYKNNNQQILNNNNNNNMNININPNNENHKNNNQQNLNENSKNNNFFRNNDDEHNKDKNSNNNLKNSANLLKSNDYGDEYDYNNDIDLLHLFPIDGPPPPLIDIEDPYPEPEPFLPPLPTPPQPPQNRPPLPPLPPPPPFILDHPAPTLPPATIHQTVGVTPTDSPHGPPIHFSPLPPQNFPQPKVHPPRPTPTNQPQYSSTPVHGSTHPPRPTQFLPTTPPNDNHNNFAQLHENFEQNQQNHQNNHQNPQTNGQTDGPSTKPDQYRQPFDSSPQPPQQELYHHDIPPSPPSFNVHQTNQNSGGDFYYPPAGPNVDFYHSHVQNSNSINDSTFQKLMKVIYSTLYYGDLEYKRHMKRETSDVTANSQ